MAVHEVLRTWRTAAGMSLADVAKLMGWASSAAVHHHESGRTPPNASTLRRYSEIYGRSREDLVGALLLLAGGEGGIGPSNSGQDEAPSAEAVAP